METTTVTRTVTKPAVTVTVTEPATTSALATPPSAADFAGDPSCMVYNTSANVRVRALALSVKGVCAALARQLSTSGAYWTQVPRGLDTTAGNGTLQLVCRAADSTGALELEVLDTGGLMNGTAICSSLIAKGWYDLTG